MGLIKKTLNRVTRHAKNIIFRLSNRSLRFAQSLHIVHSSLSISASCNIRGSVVCEESLIQMGSKCLISPNACLSFSGKETGFRADDGVEIGPYSDIGGGAISIGKNTTAHSHFICQGDVSIGSDTVIAPRVFISSGTHIAKTREKIRVQDAQYCESLGRPPNDPVHIGNDCWLGANVVIMPGITLGDGCVVGAGSIVTQSFPAYSIIAGVPAKIIKTRE